LPVASSRFPEFLILTKVLPRAGIEVVELPSWKAAEDAATMTSFSGLASLPIIRADLVLSGQVLTDEQLNTAVIVSRATPGPVGITWSASATRLPGCRAPSPAGRRSARPRFSSFRSFISRRVKQRIAACAARRMRLSRPVPACSFAAVAPLAREALTDTLTIGIAVVCAVLIFRKVNPLWLVAGASLAGLATAIVAHG